MRKLGVVLVLLAIIVGGALGYTSVMKPAQRPPSTEKVDLTMERTQRGKYLVEHVVICFDCHSEPDLTRWDLPHKPGTLGGGMSRCWDQSLGLPGRVCFPNITPDEETGIGKWTDGELLRAIREGVTKDGDAEFLMPYPSFAYLSDEDAKSIVAYLRTIPPIKAKRERSKIDFPVNILIKFGPKPLPGPVPEPDRHNSVEYGRYLTRVAGCEACHTPVDEKHLPIAGKEFAGGQEFFLAPEVKVVSANITPHKTGLGDKTKEEFIGLFRSFSDASLVSVEVPIEENTLMPYLEYAGMSDADLGAIYDFLHTVKPIDNAVVKHPPPKPKISPARSATTAKPKLE